MALLRPCNFEDTLLCKICGRVVHQEQWEGENPFGQKGYFWLPTPHVGKCGLMCVGGWVECAELLPHKVHDSDCEFCNNW